MPGLKHEQQIIFNEQMRGWLWWRMQKHFTNYPRSGSKVSVFVQTLEPELQTEQPTLDRAA